LIFFDLFFLSRDFLLTLMSFLLLIVHGLAIDRACKQLLEVPPQLSMLPISHVMGP
jgi:hypothetical protein